MYRKCTEGSRNRWETQLKALNQRDGEVKLNAENNAFKTKQEERQSGDTKRPKDKHRD